MREHWGSLNALALVVEVRGPEKVLKDHSEAVSLALGIRTLDAVWSSGRHSKPVRKVFLNRSGRSAWVQKVQKDRRMPVILAQLSFSVWPWSLNMCQGKVPVVSVCTWPLVHLTPCALDYMWLGFTLRLMVGHVLGSDQENSLVCFGFVKCWLSKDLNPQIERNKVENPVEFTEPVSEQEFIVGLQNNHYLKWADLTVVCQTKWRHSRIWPLNSFGQCTGHWTQCWQLKRNTEENSVYPHICSTQRPPLPITMSVYNGHIWRQGIGCKLLRLEYKMLLLGSCIVCLVPAGGAVWRFV